MSFVAGASASIMKTIAEIEAILDGEDLSWSEKNLQGQV